ncbi:MAG: hypothetical protein ABI912_08725, partial [Actinomycetota bacterium]
PHPDDEGPPDDVDTSCVDDDGGPGDAWTSEEPESPPMPVAPPTATARLDDVALLSVTDPGDQTNGNDPPPF